MSEIFATLNAEINDCDYEVESAMFVNPQEHVVVPGIQVLHNDAEMPVFFSVQDLRDMADEAEAIVMAQITSDSTSG